MKRKSVIALGMSLATLGVAHAQDAPPMFDKLDTDKDGYLSIYEAESNMSLLEQFSQLDQNGDGRLNREEFAEFKG